jgi:pSer/pThr/pTyr-binding forkhead associated (FHA) protein
LFLDKEISRRHALIKLEAGKFVIQDQNSLNGTYVNSERVDAPRILQDGDVIFVGVSDLKYEEG